MRRGTVSHLCGQLVASLHRTTTENYFARKQERMSCEGEALSQNSVESLSVVALFPFSDNFRPLSDRTHVCCEIVYADGAFSLGVDGYFSESYFALAITRTAICDRFAGLVAAQH